MLRRPILILVLLALVACKKKAAPAKVHDAAPAEDAPAKHAHHDFVVEYAAEDRGVALVVHDALTVSSTGRLELYPGDGTADARIPKVLEVDDGELATLESILEDPASRLKASAEATGEGKYRILNIKTSGWEARLDMPLPVPDYAEVLVEELERLADLVRASGKPVEPLADYTITSWTEGRGTGAPKPSVLTVDASGEITLGWIKQPAAVTAQLPAADLSVLAHLLASPSLHALTSVPDDDLGPYVYLSLASRKDPSLSLELMLETPLPRPAYQLMRELGTMRAAAKLPESPPN